MTLKHSAKKLGAGIGMGLGYGTAAAVIDAFTVPGLGQAIVNPALQASQAALSRQYEREADYHGLQHAFHSGFDVDNGSQVFIRLGSDAPGFQVLAYTFASHPNAPERALRLEKAQEEFKKKYPEKYPMKTREDWQLVVPVEAGESLEAALEKLSNANLAVALANGGGTAGGTKAAGTSTVFDDFDFTADTLRPMK